MRITSKSIIALILLALFIPAGNAVSQESNMSEVYRAHFMIGGTTFDLDPLNDRLKSAGYSSFPDQFFTIGGGFFNKATDRVLVGVEGHLLVGEGKSSVIGGKEYSSSAIGGYGFLNSGLLVVENEILDLYPVLGIGFGGIRCKIGQSAFDDILAAPHGAANLNTFSFMLNLALGADFKVRIPDGGPGESFFVIGLRGGYALPFYDSGWYMDEFSLSGAPDGGIGGPYGRITIGGGPIPHK